jgi:hypothetical protein
MYLNPTPDEFVIYAGHVVLLRQLDPRHFDRAGQISERNFIEKTVSRKICKGKNKTESGGRQQIFGERAVKI